MWNRNRELLDDPSHICLDLDGGAQGGGDQRQRGDAAQEARGGRGGQDGASEGAQVAQTGYQVSFPECF